MKTAEMVMKRTKMMIAEEKFKQRFTSEQLSGLYQSLGYNLTSCPCYHDANGNPKYMLSKLGDDSRDVAWFPSGAEEKLRNTGIATFDWLDINSEYKYTQVHPLAHYDWLLYASHAFGVAQSVGSKKPDARGPIIVCAWPVEVKANPFFGKLAAEEVMITSDLLRSNSSI